jgi:hypothetical protein
VRRFIELLRNEGRSPLGEPEHAGEASSVAALRLAEIGAHPNGSPPARTDGHATELVAHPCDEHEQIAHGAARQASQPMALSGAAQQGIG